MAFTTLPAAWAKLRAAVLSSAITELRPLVVVKQVNENLAGSTALQDDNELRLTYAANCLYRLSASIIHSSNGSADFKFQLAETGGGGTTGYVDVIAIPSGGSALTIQSGTLATVFTGEGAAADRAMRVDGWLSTGTLPGDLKLTWAQVVATSSTDVVAKSWLALRRWS